MDNDKISIDVLTVKQPIGEFYVGKIPAHKLLQLSYSDLRRLEDRDIERRIGIQRPLNQDRVRQIRQYIHSFDSSFPNSIILNLNPHFLCSEDSEEGKLVICNDQRAFSIIDGQHRLAGFIDEYLPENEPFDLIVTIFIDLEVEEQALIFATINSNQTKVNPSLVVDLNEYSTLKTPSKVIHFIAKSFNTDEKSPWYKMIKMTGTKDDATSQGIITQSAFTKPILAYVCPERDLPEIRNRLKLNKKLPSYDTDQFLFWELFKDDKEEIIYRVLLNYFSSIKDTFSEQWGSKKSLLTKAIGYKAFMELFKDLHNLGKSENDLSQKFFKSSLQRATTIGANLTSEHYGSNDASVRKLYLDLKLALKL